MLMATYRNILVGFKKMDDLAETECATLGDEVTYTAYPGVVSCVHAIKSVWCCSYSVTMSVPRTGSQTEMSREGPTLPWVIKCQGVDGADQGDVGQLGPMSSFKQFDRRVNDGETSDLLRGGQSIDQAPQRA